MVVSKSQWHERQELMRRLHSESNSRYRRVLDFKYRIQSHIDLGRGKFHRWIYGKRIQSNGPELLLGGNSLVRIIGEDSKLLIQDESSQASGDGIINGHFPRAASIGCDPYWRFAFPGKSRQTKIVIQQGAKLILNENTIITSGVYLAVGNGATFRLGCGSYLAHDANFNCRSGITIGKGCLVGQQVMMMDYDGHPIFYPDRLRLDETLGGASASIEIEDDVWIGHRAIILKGVHIGQGSIIGAGACVTQSIPRNSLVGGNPAKVLKQGVSWKPF